MHGLGYLALGSCPMGGGSSVFLYHSLVVRCQCRLVSVVLYCERMSEVVAEGVGALFDLGPK